MIKVFKATRILCGILITIAGLMNMGLFGFEPPVAGPEGRPFQIAMQEAGYFLPIFTIVFIGTGISVIIDRFAALASVILFPISLNILLFHVFLEAGQLIAAIIFFLMNCFLLWYYRKAYVPLFKSKL